MNESSGRQAVQPLGSGSVLQLADPLTTLSRCPQCHTAKPTLNMMGAMYRDPQSRSSAFSAWAVYQCSSCGNPVTFLTQLPLIDNVAEQIRFIRTHKPRILEMQPQRQDDFGDWPARAKRYMEQAVESLHAPDAAVMLAGSAVDAMLKEKGLEKDSVYKRIEKAVEDHLLTAEMGEWAHSVRLAANSPRHADLEDPHSTPEQALAALDFAKALGQFLFVLPARIARGREAAEKASIA